jgi:hypothetical protein
MTNTYEAFVYIWIDARVKPNKYYIGYHAGSITDNYAHSSTVYERFTMQSIPEKNRRRILAYGTCEEMKELEVKLLTNRKNKCWDRYYNVKWYSSAIGDVKKILTEEQVILWKEKVKKNARRTPNTWTGGAIKKMPKEVRNEKYGRKMSQNGRWKGGLFNRESTLEEKREYHRKWYHEKRKSNPEHIEKSRERTRLWCEKNKSEKQRQKTGASLEDFLNA